MCEPVTIAATVMAIGSVAMSEVNRRKGNKIKDQAARQQRKVFQQKAEQAANQYAGDQIASSDQLQQLEVETLKKGASAQVSASASGTSGLSVDAVLADFQRQGGTGASTIRQQLAKRKTSTDLAVEGARLGTESALFNLRKEKFNPIAAVLTIGQGALAGYTAGKAGPTKGPAKTSGITDFGAGMTDHG